MHNYWCLSILNQTCRKTNTAYPQFLLVRLVLGSILCELKNKKVRTNTSNSSLFQIFYLALFRSSPVSSPKQMKLQYTTTAAVVLCNCNHRKTAIKTTTTNREDHGGRRYIRTVSRVHSDVGPCRRLLRHHLRFLPYRALYPCPYQRKKAN